MGWERKIVAWGNSLAIRLPSQIFRKTDLKEGDPVKFEVIDECTLKLSLADQDLDT